MKNCLLMAVFRGILNHVVGLNNVVGLNSSSGIAKSIFRSPDLRICMQTDCSYEMNKRNMFHLLIPLNHSSQVCHTGVTNPEVDLSDIKNAAVFIIPASLFSCSWR